MELKWTSKALSDLARLYEFLALANKPAAARAVQALTQAPTVLLANPRIGEQLFQFEPREVRRILVGYVGVFRCLLSISLTPLVTSLISKYVHPWPPTPPTTSPNYPCPQPQPYSTPLSPYLYTQVAAKVSQFPGSSY